MVCEAGWPFSVLKIVMRKHIPFLLLVVLVLSNVSIEADFALVLDHGLHTSFPLHFTALCRCFYVHYSIIFQ